MAGMPAGEDLAVGTADIVVDMADLEGGMAALVDVEGMDMEPLVVTD